MMGEPAPVRGCCPMPGGAPAGIIMLCCACAMLWCAMPGGCPAAGMLSAGIMPGSLSAVPVTPPTGCMFGAGAPPDGTMLGAGSPPAGIMLGWPPSINPRWRMPPPLPPLQPSAGPPCCMARSATETSGCAYLRTAAAAQAATGDKRRAARLLAALMPAVSERAVAFSKLPRMPVSRTDKVDARRFGATAKRPGRPRPLVLSGAIGGVLCVPARAAREDGGCKPGGAGRCGRGSLARASLPAHAGMMQQASHTRMADWLSAEPRSRGSDKEFKTHPHGEAVWRKPARRCNTCFMSCPSPRLLSSVPVTRPRRGDGGSSGGSGRGAGCKVGAGGSHSDTRCRGDTHATNPPVFSSTSAGRRRCAVLEAVQNTTAPADRSPPLGAGAAAMTQMTLRCRGPTGQATLSGGKHSLGAGWATA
eukprot:363392-Chlamydomonas_euryale.AAC.2